MARCRECAREGSGSVAVDCVRVQFRDMHLRTPSIRASMVLARKHSYMTSRVFVFILVSLHMYKVQSVHVAHVSYRDSVGHV